jgi:cyclopropane fatty-acyl-phospholipid synthase-like methyltransferase
MSNQQDNVDSMASQADLDALLEDTNIWKARIILTAVDLGLFTLMSQSGRTVVELARLTGADTDRLERLMQALIELGYSKRNDDQTFSNMPVSHTFLDQHSCHYIGSWIRLQSLEWSMWGSLTETIMGKPKQDTLSVFEDEERLTTLVLAAHQRALLAHVEEVVASVELSNCRTLLDVGSGAGTFSLAFAHRWPNLICYLLDKPLVIKIAQEIVRDHGLQSRFRFLPADYLKDDFGGPYDACFISNVLHGESEKNMRDLIAKCALQLSQGGQFIIRDNFLDEDGTSSAYGATFGLAMMLETTEGRAWKRSEIIHAGQAAGLSLRSSHQRLLIFSKPI